MKRFLSVAFVLACASAQAQTIEYSNMREYLDATLVKAGGTFTGTSDCTVTVVSKNTTTGKYARSMTLNPYSFKESIAVGGLSSRSEWRQDAYLTIDETTMEILSDDSYRSVSVSTTYNMRDASEKPETTTVERVRELVNGLPATTNFKVNGEERLVSVRLSAALDAENVRWVSFQQSPTRRGSTQPDIEILQAYTLCYDTWTAGAQR